MIPYITNGLSWTLFLDNKPITITPSDIRFDKINNALITNDEQEVKKLLAQTPLEHILGSEDIKKSFKDLTFIEKATNSPKRDIQTYYKDQKLPTVLEDKLVYLYEAGCTDFSHYTKFLDNLFENPSKKAQEELYKFLSYKELPITENGTFIAYKGVTANLYSVRGNTDTIILKGKSDKCGRICNKIGTEIEVDISSVDPDCKQECSYGLHVGSFNYAVNWSEVVLAVEVNPKDVVSVPVDCEFQKCRVRAYKVLNIVKKEYKTPEVKVENAEVLEPKDWVERTSDRFLPKLLTSDNIQKTFEAITRNIKSHGNKTTIAQLSSSVGRKTNETYDSMISLALRLGFTVKATNTDGKYLPLGKYIVTM